MRLVVADLNEPTIVPNDFGFGLCGVCRGEHASPLLQISTSNKSSAKIVSASTCSLIRLITSNSSQIG